MTCGGDGDLVGSLVVLGLAACGKQWLAEREPWRHEAEVACLKSGLVKEGPALVRIQPISGPGICGADFPLKVAALGEGSIVGFADELRPPGGIPNVRQPLADQQLYTPRPASPYPAQQYPQQYPAAQQYPAPQQYPPPQIRGRLTLNRVIRSRPTRSRVIRRPRPAHRLRCVRPAFQSLKPTTATRTRRRRASRRTSRSIRRPIRSSASKATARRRALCQAGAIRSPIRPPSRSRSGANRRRSRLAPWRCSRPRRSHVRSCRHSTNGLPMRCSRRP